MFYCFYVEYLYFCTKFNVKQKNLLSYCDGQSK